MAIECTVVVDLVTASEREVSIIGAIGCTIVVDLVTASEWEVSIIGEIL